MDKRMLVSIKPDRIFFLIYILCLEVIFPVFSYNAIVYYCIYILYIGTFVVFNTSSIQSIIKDKILIGYVLFLVLNLGISALVSVDKTLSYQYLQKFFEMTIMVFVIYVYAKEDGNIDYPAKVILIIATAMAFIILFGNATSSVGGDGTVYVSISEGVNAHGVAVIELFGAWATLYLLPKKRLSWNRVMIAAFLNIAFIVAIYLTNSRKAIIGIAILYVFSFSAINKLLKAEFGNGKRLLALFAMIVIVFGLWYIGASDGKDLLYTNNLLERLKQNTANDVRLDLILEGFRIFLNKPITGVGFNNFRYYSTFSFYSHCTYAELFACCGLLGGIPFIVLLLKPVIGTLKVNASDYVSIYRKRIMIDLCIVVLFVGWTQIIFYERYLMYIIGCIGGFIVAERSKCENG